MSGGCSCVVGGDHLRPFVMPTFIHQREGRPKPRTSLVSSHTVCISWRTNLILSVLEGWNL